MAAARAKFAGASTAASSTAPPTRRPSPSGEATKPCSAKKTGAGNTIGGLAGRLMAKDLRLYLTLTQDLGVTTLTGPSTLTAFEVSNALGYGDLISNRVVDAFGDQIEEALENPVDFKSLLQERLARRSELVHYRIESEDGPPH